MWDFAKVKELHQEHSAELLQQREEPNGLGTIGLIDETSAAKKADLTPGVKRQYLGCLGKIENGIVTVHLGVCRGLYKSLIDADLFLPQDWSDDRPRCRAAGIPDAVVYRPKWQIALEQIDRAKSNGIVFDWITFDEGYGHSPGFIAGLDKRNLPFVGEVPRTFSCLAVNRSGNHPDDEIKGKPAEDVVRTGSLFRSQSWQIVRLERQTMQDQAWRVKASQVWLHSRGLVGTNLLADLGVQRGNRGGEVLPIQRSSECLGGNVDSRRLPALERGTQLSCGQIGTGLHAFRGEKLHGVDAAYEPVLGRDGIRSRAHGAAEGKKSRSNIGTGMPGIGHSEPALATQATGNQ